CGARSSDGLEMLVRQAGLAFTLWFKREAPLEQMRSAARTAIQA
ncbi:MAG: shikimate dehydrogenase, partial [Herpetosiphonaceae bacterium]|nr:shikimate dehydrogenase [Herpetosiphonaceae bacterium]